MNGDELFFWKANIPVLPLKGLGELAFNLVKELLSCKYVSERGVRALSAQWTKPTDSKTKR